jgi:hypothetical protein
LQEKVHALLRVKVVCEKSQGTTLP